MTLLELPEVRALSPAQKLRLVDEIWLSVAPHLDELPVAARTKRLLDQRWAKFLKNPGSALTMAQFKRRLSALRP